MLLDYAEGPLTPTERDLRRPEGRTLFENREERFHWYSGIAQSKRGPGAQNERERATFMESKHQEWLKVRASSSAVLPVVLAVVRGRGAGCVLSMSQSGLTRSALSGL